MLAKTYCNKLVWKKKRKMKKKFQKESFLYPRKVIYTIKVKINELWGYTLLQWWTPFLRCNGYNWASRYNCVSCGAQLRIDCSSTKKLEVKIVLIRIVINKSQSIKTMQVEIAEYFSSLIVVAYSTYRGNTHQTFLQNKHEVIGVHNWVKNAHSRSTELKIAGIAWPSW